MPSTTTYGRLQRDRMPSLCSNGFGGHCQEGRRRGGVRAPRINGADAAPKTPASFQTLEDVQLERAVEGVRRERVETERAEEVVKEFGFRRAVLLAVLCILGLVALGSLAVVVAGIITGQYPLAAGAVAPLSGSGAMSVLAWRIYGYEAQLIVGIDAPREFRGAPQMPLRDAQRTQGL